MNQTASLESRPWEQPFWKPAPGKWLVFTHLVVIHALAIIGVILFPFPGAKVLGAALLLTILGGFGTTVCYHRLLSHRTLKLNKIVENILIFWAMLNGSGAPASWVAYHRLHHSHTDTPDDISSPSHGGFWWAHMRWLYQTPRADKKRWCPELTVGAYRFWESAELPVIVLSLFSGVLLGLGWAGFFWVGAIRLVYSLHMQCLVNSLTHLGKGEGTDHSRNVWWLGPLQLSAWGENWHKDHHTYAGSARLGLRWWQTDIGWYLICALEAIGLASNVKRPSLR